MTTPTPDELIAKARAWKRTNPDYEPAEPIDLGRVVWLDGGKLFDMATHHLPASPPKKKR